MAIHESDIADIKRSLYDLHVKVDTLTAEIGPGIPPPDQRGDRETIRGRLHKSEAEIHATKALTETLLGGLQDVKQIAGDLKRERDETRIAQNALETARMAQKQAVEQTWSRRGRIGLFIFAAIGALGTAVSILVLILDRAAS